MPLALHHEYSADLRVLSIFLPTFAGKVNIAFNFPQISDSLFKELHLSSAVSLPASNIYILIFLKPMQECGVCL